MRMCTANKPACTLLFSLLIYTGSHTHSTASACSKQRFMTPDLLPWRSYHCLLHKFYCAPSTQDDVHYENLP